WQAFVRQRAGYDTDVNEGLHADQKRNSRAKQQAKSVRSVDGNIDSANDNGNEGNDDEEGRDDAKLLADDGQNEVGMMLRDKAELLPAVAQALAGPSSSPQRQHGLVCLIDDVQFVPLEL